MLEFVTGPIGQILGWLFGAVSLLLAIFFYIKQRVRYGLSYDIFHHAILRPTTYADVRILANYAGHETSSLVDTLLLVKNSGNQTIKRQDLDGIHIESNGTILGGQLITTIPGSSYPTFHVLGPRTALIEFNFLRPGDALLLSVLHTDQKLGLDVWAEGAYIGDLKYRQVRNHRLVLLLASLWFAILVGAVSAVIYKALIGGGDLSPLKPLGIAALVSVLLLFGYFDHTEFTSEAEKKFLELTRY